MAIVNLPQMEESPKYYVYALICVEDGTDDGYIKFGRSQNVTSRLSSIRSTCPIPARYFATLDTGYCIEKSKLVERELHRKFAHRRVKGEWFRFNFANAEDKEDFNQGCKAVFALEFKPPAPWWTKISVEEMDAYNKQRRREFLTSKHRRKIEAKARYRSRQKAAWRELG